MGFVSQNSGGAAPSSGWATPSTPSSAFFGAAPKPAPAPTYRPYNPAPASSAFGNAIGAYLNKSFWPGITDQALSAAGQSQFSGSVFNPPAQAAYDPGGGGAPEVPPMVAFDPNQDPGYAMALSNQQQGNTQLDAALKSQREQAIIDFGDPALASMAGFGMDPQAGAFAQQNYLSGNSTLSRLDKAHKDQRQAVINHLAATGMLFSGDTGYREGQADSTYGNNVYDARKSVLNALTGMASQNMAGKQANSNSLLQALMAAYQNYAMQVGQSAGGYGGGYGGSYGPPATAATPGPGTVNQLYGTAPRTAAKAAPKPAARPTFRRIGP